jgi:hypothetical protein
MIWRGEPYVTLMASLPAIRFLSEKTPPINRARLTDRLKDLTPEDGDLLHRLMAVISWRFVDVAQEDAAFLDRAEALLADLRSPALVGALSERLELRTLVAALRRRHAGEDAPPKGVRWGFGRHVERIRTGWAAPDFGLGGLFPWIATAREKLETGDPKGLERLLLDVAWAQQARWAEGHEFDFEAVVFYMLRWSMADRWAQYDADAARRRFAELLDAARAEVPSVPEAA